MNVSSKQLNDVLMAAQAASEDGLPPVHLWDPPHCGDIGMEVRRDGSWWYQGSPIGRERIVRLFSRILRRDDDGLHYLVTPVEKVVVHVEVAPFLAVRADVAGEGPDQKLVFTTNVGDVFTAGPEAPIQVDTDPETLEPKPCVRVRARLDALVTRPVFFELVEMAEERESNEGAVLGVWSDGAFFPLGPAAAHHV